MLVWLALLCSLLLPVTAVEGMTLEMRASQASAAECGLRAPCSMPNCHCHCCPGAAASHLNGCRCASGFLPYLTLCRTIIQDRQGVSYQFGEVAPVFRAFPRDIFHPPEAAAAVI